MHDEWMLLLLVYFVQRPQHVLFSLLTQRLPLSPLAVHLRDVPLAYQIVAYLTSTETVSCAPSPMPLPASSVSSIVLFLFSFFLPTIFPCKPVLGACYGM